MELTKKNVTIKQTNWHKHLTELEKSQFTVTIKVGDILLDTTPMSLEKAIDIRDKLIEAAKEKEYIYLPQYPWHDLTGPAHVPAFDPNPTFGWNTFTFGTTTGTDTSDSNDHFHP